MEVTKTNFRDVFPSIKKAISEATFIAIDCEMTGLNIGANVNPYDTPAQYYEKVQRATKDYLVIQYGLCIFRYDSKRKIFKQQGYNFYIFPWSCNRLTPDRRFLCQASSIQFLTSQGFDFNKLFKEGISYLNSIEEDKYRDELFEKQKVRLNQIQNSTSTNNEKSHSSMGVTVGDKLKVDDIFEKIEDFISGSAEEYILPRCNAFIRRLVYGDAVSRLQNRAVLETRILENKDRVLVVTRFKGKELQEKEDQKKVEQENEEFQACIGFAEVIKCIVESGKLVVGHNMLLDVLHTIEKFLTPLPDDYDEFKELAFSVFSNTVDTKYMSSIAPFNEITDSSVLSHLLETVKKKPFVLPTVEVDECAQGYRLESDKAHEAGYDAFITGICFLAMWMYLGREEYEDPYDVFGDLSSLTLYKNRLFLMRVQDIPCIHLGAKDVVPNRDHVLYLTFPKEWKQNDITNLFSPFGNINIAWIDDRSAYVALHSHEKTAIALSTLSQSDLYTVTTYARRQAQLEGHKLIPCSPKRRLSDSLSSSMKKRSRSLGSNSSRKRSFDTIEEDPEELLLATPETVNQKGGLWSYNTPKKIKKAFNEDSNWT